MFIHHKHLIPFSFSLFILLPITTLSIPSTITTYQSKDHIFINFGLSKSTNTVVGSGNKWQSDNNFLITLPLNSTTNTTTSIGYQPPYNTARIFRAPTNYLVPLSSWGPKFVRLYLYPPLFQTTPPSYNSIDTTNSFLSLSINGIEILRNFNAYQFVCNASANTKTNAPTNSVVGLVREIYLEVKEGVGEKSINLTFIPSYPNGFGFISGVEIVSLPNEIYVNHSSINNVPYLSGNPDDYIGSFYEFPKFLAMENVIRLNVGGTTVVPSNDSGVYRTWYDDNNFVITFNKSTPSTTINVPTLNNINYNATSTPQYIAPFPVYSTMRELGPYYPNLKKNLSWSFEVDGGFDYLVRLHFCELDYSINQTGQIMFDIHINGQMAYNQFDVYTLAGGRDNPIYRDYVTLVDGYGSRVLLWVTLVPDDTIYHDVLLNGLEIFKISKNGSLAAPNPSPPMNLTPIYQTQKKTHSSHIIPIVGAILGTIILALILVFVCFMINYKRKKAKQKFTETMSKEDSSKINWISPLDDSSSNKMLATVGSSLPSDLCRRFSLAQIKIATCDFDEDLVIGVGGFGKVYKGVIDDGATSVAIKRQNTTSKQGAKEFQTEIEMLSRLRHVNLVALIGYCEDQGEMILVYEYMPHGTLRDHLMYKNLEKNDNLTPLSWKRRLMICIGSARGLHYLHAGAKQLIIHRDVKSTNILLDDNWTAKVSDFGLSKIGAISTDGSATHVSTAVKGSFGYLDPEYYTRQKLTEKSDVYSFGVLLFEVLCARPALNPNLPKEQVNLALWARNHYKNGTLHLIVDPKIRDQIAPECLRKVGEISETCVRDRGVERPSIGDVVWGLEFALQLQETAENNNNMFVENQGKLSNHPIFNHDLVEGVSCNDVSTNSGNNNFSESNIMDSEERRVLESKTTMSVSSSDYPIHDPKSISAFSEIIDPKAR